VLGAAPTAADCGDETDATDDEDGDDDDDGDGDEGKRRDDDDDDGDGDGGGGGGGGGGGAAAHDVLVPWLVARCGGRRGGGGGSTAARAAAVAAATPTPPPPVARPKDPDAAARDPDRLLDQLLSVQWRLLPAAAAGPDRRSTTAVFDVPEGSEKLLCKNGVMCRGATFALVPGRAPGTVECRFESPAPEATAKAIAARVSNRLNDPSGASVEDCCIS